MAKAFFAALAVGLGLVLWLSLPRGIMRPCPVCQGSGSLPLSAPIYEGKAGQWQEKKALLCPFCAQGRISLHDLREKRELMMRWMVREQKLDPQELVRRVEAAWGKPGLDELHKRKFFIGSN